MNQEITVCVCKRCGHRWFPRAFKPARCPKCQSKNWDKPDRRTEVELADHNAMKEVHYGRRK